MAEAKKKKKKKASWQSWLVPGVIGIVLLSGVVLVVRIFLSDSGPSKKSSFQMVTLIKPPPPEVKEKPPEPEVQKQAPKESINTPTAIPQPQNQPQNNSQDDSPPAGDISVEGDGSAGSNAFGLGSKRPGTGRDVTTIKGNGGGGMSRLALLAKYGWYTSKIQEEIKRQFKKRMEKEGGTPKGKYEITLKVLLDPQGVVRKYRIVTSSGNDKMDEAFKLLLPGLKISQLPPEGMPPLVTLRIVSQG
ncbi:MAG: TonB C-terminal domain-containing protein [Desulfuromonadales bacterium]|nr:TonB C-terminal domain-containing protein [Desulfuromonadales bacterium]